MNEGCKTLKHSNRSFKCKIVKKEVLFDLDKNRGTNAGIMFFGGEIMVYVNKNVPCRIINTEEYVKCLEVILLEFSLRKKKWLCFGLYKPPDKTEQIFLDAN